MLYIVYLIISACRTLLLGPVTQNGLAFTPHKMPPKESKPLGTRHSEQVVFCSYSKCRQDHSSGLLSCITK